MPEVLWKIVYGDGSTYSNLDGPAKEAPGWDVLMVLEKSRKVGVRPWKGEYYFFTKEGWVATDNIGFVDWVVNHRDEWTAAFVGRYYPDERFDEIQQKESMDFPRKSGVLEDEKRWV